MKRSILLFAIVFLPHLSFAQLNEKTYDFWVGKWNLTWTDANGGQGKGTNHLERILDGKVIQEHFEGLEGQLKGYKGTSISVFNAQQGTWHQTWQDNQGGNIVFTGREEAGKKYFETVMTNDQQSRMVFYNFESDGFTWDWEATQDGGKTWNLNWRINYKKAQ